MPQFPCLYVTSPTYPGKDLLLLIFVVHSQSFTYMFWGIFSHFRGADGTSKITQHLSYSSAQVYFQAQVNASPWMSLCSLQRERGVDTGHLALARSPPTHTEQLSSPSTESRCSTCRFDQRSNCWFPRAAAKTFSLN